MRGGKIVPRYGLTLTDTLKPEESLKERIAHALIPETVASLFEETSGEVTRRLDRLGSGLETFDPTLAAALGKSRAKILYQIEKLRKKTERETLRRDARASEEARYLSSLLYPHRHMQERFYWMLPFLRNMGWIWSTGCTSGPDGLPGPPRQSRFNAGRGMPRPTLGPRDGRR